MKNIGFIIVFLMGCFTANSQITVTNSTFPKVGDNLKYATLVTPGITLDLKSTAGPHEWDFEVLNRGVKFEESYVDPSTGNDAAAFTDADILYLNGQEERYVKSSTNNMEELGFGGINPIFNAPLVIRYTTRPVIRQAPLTFIGSTQSNSTFRIALPASVFPDSLLAIFPDGFKPDSVRVEFSSTSKGLIDAYGTLKMQGQSYSVLREKAETTSTTSILIKIGFLGWVNLQDLAKNFGFPLPPFIGQFLGNKENIVYNFHTNDKKEVLVSATYDLDNELQEVVFADLGSVSATKNSTVAQVMDVYPNPASDILNIKIGDRADGMYLITIADINGNVLYAEPCLLTGSDSKKIDVSRYATGIYFLTVRDQFNQQAVTSKVLIGR